MAQVFELLHSQEMMRCSFWLLAYVCPALTIMTTWGVNHISNKYIFKNKQKKKIHSEKAVPLSCLGSVPFFLECPAMAVYSKTLSAEGWAAFGQVKVRHHHLLIRCSAPSSAERGRGPTLADQYPSNYRYCWIPNCPCLFGIHIPEILPHGASPGRGKCQFSSYKLWQLERKSVQNHFSPS